MVSLAAAGWELQRPSKGERWGTVLLRAWQSRASANSSGCRQLSQADCLTHAMLALACRWWQGPGAYSGLFASEGA